MLDRFLAKGRFQMLNILLFIYDCKLKYFLFRLIPMKSVSGRLLYLTATQFSQISNRFNSLIRGKGGVFFWAKKGVENLVTLPL